MYIRVWPVLKAIGCLAFNTGQIWGRSWCRQLDASIFKFQYFMPKEFYQTWRINSVSEYGNCMQTGTLPQHVICQVMSSSGSGNQCIVVLIIASLNRNQTNCNDCTPDFSIESQYHVCCISTHTLSMLLGYYNTHTHPFLWCGWSLLSRSYRSAHLHYKHHSGPLLQKSRWYHHSRFSEQWGKTVKQ